MLLFVRTVTDLKKPMENPPEAPDSFGAGLGKALGINWDNASLLVALFLLAGAFVWFVFLNPAGRSSEVAQKTPPQTAVSRAKTDETFKARAESVKVIVRAGGAVQAAKTTKIYSPINGRIIDVPTALSSKVTSATVVAKFDTDAMQSKVNRAKAVYDRAQAELEQAKKSTEARPEDLKIIELNLDIAKADLEAARADLAAADIKAPGAGILESLAIAKGQAVSAGQLIGEIVNEDDYILEGWVDASDASALHLDSTASVEFSSRRDEVFGARISSFGVAVEPQSGVADQVPIQLKFDKGQKLDWLRIGLRGAEVEIPAMKSVIPVPRTAVASEGTRHLVFVKSGKRFVPRAVEIGLFDDEMIEVTDGLRENEVIAVD